jgi:hypothetical protein
VTLYRTNGMQVTDAKDRRTLMVLLDQFYNEEAVLGGADLAPGAAAQGSAHSQYCCPHPGTCETHANGVVVWCAQFIVQTMNALTNVMYHTVNAFGEAFCASLHMADNGSITIHTLCLVIFTQFNTYNFKVVV